MVDFLQANALPFLRELGDIVLPLLLAAIAGGAVGLERESTNQPAGLRTHVLVCVGSALIMQVSLDMYELSMTRGFGNGDPGRIAAQVVSGIGFLGAGTIMREGANIRGLTTAASLWVVSGMGLAVGAGMYLQTLLAVVLVLITLKTLSEVEKRYIVKAGSVVLTVHVTDTPGRLGAVASICGRWGASVKNVSIRSGPITGTIEISLNLRLAGRNVDPAGLIGELMASEGVISVTEED